MTALWVVVCLVALIAVVAYLILRRPRVLPDERGDSYPYMIESPPRGPGAPAPAAPDDGDEEEDDIEIDAR